MKKVGVAQEGVEGFEGELTVTNPFLAFCNEVLSTTFEYELCASARVEGKAELQCLLAELPLLCC